jgi:hypothetical protein
MAGDFVIEAEQRVEPMARAKRFPDAIINATRERRRNDKPASGGKGQKGLISQFEELISTLHPLGIGTLPCFYNDDALESSEKFLRFSGGVVATRKCRINCNQILSPLIV